MQASLGEGMNSAMLRRVSFGFIIILSRWEKSPFRSISPSWIRDLGIE